MADVQNVTLNTFPDAVERSALPVVVDFYATWCGPCRMLAPVLDDLAEDYEGRVKFVRVNVDEDPDLAQRFRIGAVPTVLLLSGGKIAATRIGFVPRQSLVPLIDALLQASPGQAAS
jgi:thioredoxin 1